MDFNFDDYGAELDRLMMGQQNLGAADSQPNAAPDSNLVPSQPADPTNLGAAPQPGAPAAAQAPPAKIPVMPDGFQPKFDEAKLKDAKTVPQLVDAMHPKSRTEFMDWWEQQYGSINKHFDQLHAQLGTRPDPDRPLTKKDKWSALMEFGLNLIKSSQSPAQGGQDNLGGAVAVAAGNTVAGTEQKRNLERDTFDAKTRQVEQDRAGALKNLGTYGEALKGQSAIDTDAARKTMYERTRPTNLGQPVGTDQGLIERDPQGQWRQIKDDQGHPYTNLKVGSHGGVERDTRASEEKKFDHLTSLGIPKDLAMRIAYHQVSGNPVKDYKDVFNTALRANFGNDKKAKQVADSFVSLTYGEDAVADAQRPKIAEDAPPTAQGAPPLTALKPGQITTFKNGTRWRIGKSGQPEQVK